jgi:orotate phosphoribosyltransferase
LTGFPEKALVAELTARMLLEVEAVHFRPDEPFRFTSGLASPVYIDCRKLISYPRIRTTLMDFAASTILQEIGFEVLDAIAGGETAGIPFAAWIADRLTMPMQYVRKKAKGFGRGAQIEGDFKEGSRILLVEDLATDGRTKIKFCEALRAAGLTVNHTFVIFHYDIFPQTKVMLGEYGIQMHALATWWDVIRVARERKFLDAKTVDEVLEFLRAPEEWSSAHGGAVYATMSGATA